MKTYDTNNAYQSDLNFTVIPWIPDLEIEYNLKKECIPVGCVPPARYRLTETLLDGDPRTETPWTETPLSCDQ